MVVYILRAVRRTARPTEPGARNEAILKTVRYDAFLAAPMSAFGSDAEYQESRGRMVALIAHIQARHGLERVYYAGLRASSSSEFTSPEAALAEDMNALRSTSIFILIYPSKIVSSVLVEVGYAMALSKPCLLLARRRDDLPYLLLSAEGLSGTHGFPFLRVITYRDDDDLPGALDTGIPAALATLSEPACRAESLAAAPALPTRTP